MSEPTVYGAGIDKICIDFDPEAHKYGIGVDMESLDAVPSASEVVGMLPKYLAGWAQNCGIDGALAVVQRATLRRGVDGEHLIDASRLDNRELVLQQMKQMRLDHDSKRNDAAARGTTVHSAFRGFVENGIMPDPNLYETGEAKGYIESLRQFCTDIEGSFHKILCEQPVCSPSLGIAGTPDLYADLPSGVRVQVGGTFGKRPKYDTVIGRVLIDLKTSAQVYLSHTWQLSLYARMIEECGIQPPTSNAIVLIKPKGQGYNWKVQPSRAHVLESIVRVWEAENRPEGWLPFGEFSDALVA